MADRHLDILLMATLVSIYKQAEIGFYDMAIWRRSQKWTFIQSFNVYSCFDIWPSINRIIEYRKSIHVFYKLKNSIRQISDQVAKMADGHLFNFSMSTLVLISGPN